MVRMSRVWMIFLNQALVEMGGRGRSLAAARSPTPAGEAGGLIQ